MDFRPKRAALPQFQMTAMMDVVFLLLCFFVTSSVFSQWELGVEMDLPKAATGKASTNWSETVVLNVARDGSVSIMQRRLEGSDLGAELRRVAAANPDCTVSVRADAGTEYGKVLAVIDACVAAGLSNASFATSPAPRAAEAAPLPPPPGTEE
ncbi:MAG TPA: biopolymer transporter ExbD [Candidatus Spyradenecus faecavium]|uniref:Biopolymer transporter ExbD n=1 Tax=Candidatus Spyradenecus faecavium TaxID=2840947 RepID=A0A9D1NMU1_9BACT|nr:biopolymer transporter ExbD [Candidatus Spyradenecus faecavium]